MQESAPSPSLQRARLRRLFACGALLLGALVAALVAEVGLRVAKVDVPARRHFAPGIYRADETLAWALLPDYQGVHREYEFDARTSTNAAGFRDRPWDAARRGARWRVLCLGDSCTFGRGVHDGEDYPSQLEPLLAERLGEVAVFNAGVPGYDSVQEDLVHAILQPELRPQVVIVGWLPNDEIERSVNSRELLQVIDGQLVYDVERYQEWKRKIEGGGVYGSALYRYLKRAAKQLQGRDHDWKVDLSDLSYSQAALTRIHERAQAAGARMLLVLFPRLEELGEAPVEHHRVLASWAQERGIEVVDLPAAWRGKQAEWAQRFLPRDNVHFTPEGYRLVAEAIAQAKLWGELPR
ncbi:MAG TPA: hypothetical protein DEA08_09260 [Planctomycetes bacterium]|nr:hypothetical protein [Planctomycetota bacterium]